MNALRNLTLLPWLLMAFLSPPSAEAQALPHPIAVRIVNAHGEPQREDAFGRVVGNVEVTMSNPQRQVWTASLQCERPQVSQTGLVGWTHAMARHSRGAWMNDELCVAWTKHERAHIHVSRAFIDNWAFTERDTRVVIRSGNIHGPSWIERFRIDTGELVDECSGSNYIELTPEWARRYLDKQ